MRNDRQPARGSITPLQNTTTHKTAPVECQSQNQVVFCRGGGSIRALSPVVVDGGTRFVCHLSGIFSPVDEMKRLLLSLSSGPIKRQVELPVASIEPLYAQPEAHVVVSGANRHILTFLVEDLAWFRFNTESRDLNLQLKAKGLWAHGAGADGYTLMAGYWMRELHRMFTGVDPANIFHAGWKMTGLELCRDFAGLEFVRSDAGNFIGARLNGDDGERITVWGGEGDAVETINVGRRSSPISVCIYDKRAQIEAAKGGDGSTYESTHKHFGWDGDEKITRVELRFSGPGLCWEDKECGEILDFANPGTACDQAALDRLWELSTSKRRLVVPDTATRRERCSTDERWEKVIEAGAKVMPHDWRQHRAVQHDTHRRRVENAKRSALRGLLRYGALHGASFDPLSRVGQMKALLEDAMADELSSDLMEYQEAYARTQLPLLEPEVAQAKSELTRRHEKRMRTRR